MSLTGRFWFRKTWTGRLVLLVEEEAHLEDEPEGLHRAEAGRRFVHRAGGLREDEDDVDGKEGEVHEEARQELDCRNRVEAHGAADQRHIE